ncbi:hypothetical protein JOF53_002310 [Crossiella equi]|uniref:Uncharacterized protein n=1 Tax=Crossiella equi TaxID=130796 RepID=A0ABS5AA34_9PSEU|nr:hypothetical protein [Crossiella equi]MBP2473438.1 hypothetical protein [Crossiella equi]
MKKFRALVLAGMAGAALLTSGATASADGYVPPDCEVQFPREGMMVRCTNHAYQAVVRCQNGSYVNGPWQEKNAWSVASCWDKRTNWWVNLPG